MNIEKLSINANQFWAENINSEVWSFVSRNAVTSVTSRIENCYRHYTKALIIKDIDPEMAAIRLIAAEEELAVAVFDIIKRNEDKFIDCKHITKKFKNHFVKLLFSPAVHSIANIVSSFLANGMSIEVAEGVPSIGISIELIISKDKIMLRLHLGNTHIDASPYQFFLNKENEQIDVVEQLYKDFEKLIKSHGYSSVKEFANQRVNFRNKILYAEDAMLYDVGDEIKNVISSTSETINQVLWVIALLLSNDDSTQKKWGICRQLLQLYEKILIEAKIITAKG